MSDHAQTQLVTYTRPSVYALTAQATALFNRGAEGFDTDEELAEWQSQIDALMVKSGDKFVACRAVMTRADEEEAYCKEQAALFADRAKRFATVRERVKDLAKQLLLSHEALTGQAKIQTADGSSISLARTRQVQVVVTDLESVPTRFVRVKTEPDLAAIKAAHKLGEQVAGTECVETESVSLRFGK